MTNNLNPIAQHRVDTLTKGEFFMLDDKGLKPTEVRMEYPDGRIAIVDFSQFQVPSVLVRWLTDEENT